jgi:penicillin-binding protein 1A
MRNLIQLISQKTAIVLHWIHEKTAPLRYAWGVITAPVRRLLAPVTDAWAIRTAPLRTRWAAFKSQYPVPGNILGWLGTIFKWGFYFLLFLVFCVWIGVFGFLPSRNELKNIETANSTEVYTADTVLIGKYFIENRTAVSLDNISPHIVNALIATEDRRFLEHSGIDLMSWLRVVKGVMKKENLGGGSTLSQQLAKNLYPRQDYFYCKIFGHKLRIPFVSSALSLLVSKIKENFISIRLEQVYEKQELLSLYLNTVPFGDIFGINVASRQFYNKKPKDLTPDQAAMLVGMLKATTFYNPVRNPENATKRRNLVLRQMLINGHLTEKEYEDYSKKPLGAKRYSVDSNNDGLGTYFREYLRTDIMPKLLKNSPKEDGSSYDLYRDGLKIYTTLHSKMQQFGEESVAKHMQSLQKQFDQHWKNYKKEKPWGDDKWIIQQVHNSDRWAALKDAGMSDADATAAFEKPVKMTIFDWRGAQQQTDTTMTPIDSVRYYFCMLNCGFMAMDHRNGYVRAWVGGTNFKYFKFDHIKSTRQVGSTFKPIVYAAALKDSIKPCTYFPNHIKKIIDWEPHNSDERYGGWYTMSGGLTKSVNVIAAQVIEKVGIQKTIDLARLMGVTSDLPREFGISLGAADISLYDMMKVYGTIANQGKRPEPVVILKIVNRNGEVIYDYKKALGQNPKLGAYEQALSPTQASVMTKMLMNVVQQGTAKRMYQTFPLADFAGKTGTTQNHSDGWFICFNPQLVCGAWVGGPSPAVRFRAMSLGQGSAMALPIVSDFWFRMSKNPKLSKLLYEKFPEFKPEVLNQLGCINWIGIKPDSFLGLMQDSVFRDSIMARWRKPKEVEPNSDEEGGGEPEKAPEPMEEGERRGIIKKIFGIRKDDKEDDGKKDAKKKDEGKDPKKEKNKEENQ